MRVKFGSAERVKEDGMRVSYLASNRSDGRRGSERAHSETFAVSLGPPARSWGLLGADLEEEMKVGTGSLVNEKTEVFLTCWESSGWVKRRKARGQNSRSSSA